MPITKSAKKDIRRNARRKKMNIKKKDQIKSLVKQVKILVEEKKAEEAEKLLPQIYKALDKAAKKDTIKKNTASRKKGRITKLVTKAKG